MWSPLPSNERTTHGSADKDADKAISSEQFENIKFCLVQNSELVPGSSLQLLNFGKFVVFSVAIVLFACQSSYSTPKCRRDRILRCDEKRVSVSQVHPKSYHVLRPEIHLLEPQNRAAAPLTRFLVPRRTIPIWFYLLFATLSSQRPRLVDIES